MKNLPIARFILLFGILFASFINRAHADIEGGNIRYVHISDSTYQVFFLLYLECSGISEPSTVNMCVYNNCTNQKFTLVLSKRIGSPSGLEVPTACGTTNTKCTNSSSSLPGVRVWWYSTIVTLPVSCNNWKFSVLLSTRANSGNLTSGDFYTEAIFNNAISHSNSSPAFVVDPVYNTCLNAVTNINNGAVDDDGDSLYTTLIQPLTSASCSVSPTAITFKTLTPPLAIPGNPLPTANSFTFNGATGDMNFTPVVNGNYNVAVKVNEYRNGVLIGSVMRDIKVRTVSCNTTTPSPSFTPVLSSITGASWNNGTLYGCIGQPLQFCFDIKSSDPNAILQVSEDVAQRFPGATITYSASGDSVRGCLSWTPTAQSGGKRYVYLTIKNLECSPLPLLQHHVRAFAISMYPAVKTINDTTICPNESAVLQTSGGTGSYTWTILPGGTPGSLSCTNCPAPIATPTIQTTYVVSAQNAVCPGNINYFDTVTVSISTAPITVPSVSTSVAPGTTITQGTSATFTATVTGCTNTLYKWQKNGTDIAGAINSTWTTSLLKTGDVITCRVTCADACPQPRVVTSTPINMTVLVSVNGVAPGQGINLYPNPNNGQFNLVLNSTVNVAQPVTVEIMNVYGQIIYHSPVTQPESAIDLHGVAPGLYLLRTISDNHSEKIRFTIQ